MPVGTSGVHMWAPFEGGISRVWPGRGKGGGGGAAPKYMTLTASQRDTCPATHKRCLCPSASLPRRRRRCSTQSSSQGSPPTPPPWGMEHRAPMGARPPPTHTNTLCDSTDKASDGASRCTLPWHTGRGQRWRVSHRRPHQQPGPRPLGTPHVHPVHSAHRPPVQSPTVGDMDQPLSSWGYGVVGGPGGAYKGWIYVSVPVIGRKNGTLTVRQQSYNDVEHLFGQLGHWGLVRDIWRAILHFTLCSVLCREGVWSTRVDLGRSSGGG